MATRDLTTPFLGALDDKIFRPFYTVEMRFDEGTVRFWTGAGNIVISGITYYGAGNLLDISVVEETADLSVRGIELKLSGISDETLTSALTSDYQGRVCTLGFGALTTSSLLKEDGDFLLLEDGSKITLELLTGGVNTVFVGYMDMMNITEDGETSIITLTVENRLVTLERARVARYNDGYQQSIYPGDVGLEFVEPLQEKEIIWGSA